MNKVCSRPGMSLDYSDKILSLVGASFHMYGGHLETNSNSSLLDISGNGANVLLEPSWMQQTGSNHPDYYANVSVGSVLRIKSRVSNIPTNSGEFYTGEGLVIIDGQSYDVHGVPPVLGRAKIVQKIKDPTFLNGLPESAFVLSAGTQTTQWSSSLYTLTNPGGLLVGTKVSSGAASWCIAAPFNDGDVIGYSIDWTNSGTGNVYANTSWAIVDFIGNFPVIRQSEVFNDHGGLLGAGSIKSNPDRKNRKPAWATHLLITFNCVNQTPGTVFTIANAYITKIG